MGHAACTCGQCGSVDEQSSCPTVQQGLQGGIPLESPRFDEVDPWNGLTRTCPFENNTAEMTFFFLSPAAQHSAQHSDVVGICWIRLEYVGIHEKNAWNQHLPIQADWIYDDLWNVCLRTRLVEQHTSKVRRITKHLGGFSAASLGWLVLSTCFNMFQISFTTVIILVIWWLMIYDDIWWYMMIADDWWYMMIYDDWWWYMMICDDIWWYMMIHDQIDDIWWYTIRLMRYDNTLWLMIYDDIWWYNDIWWYMMI